MKALARTLIAAILIAAPQSVTAATHALTYESTTGQTLYWFPIGQSLADWTTYRVALTEASAPNLGSYAFTLDDSSGTRLRWKLFSGASQPANWDAYIADCDLTVKAKTDSLPSDPADASVIAGLIAALDTLIDTVITDLAAVADTVNDLEAGTAAPETRDLKPPQHRWTVTKRGDGILFSPEIMRLSPGESMVGGWICRDGQDGPSLVLPQGTGVQSFTDPTGLTAPLSATKKGTNGQWCNIEVTAASNATPGVTQYVEVEMTNDAGDGPVKLVARVLVVDPTP